MGTFVNNEIGGGAGFDQFRHERDSVLIVFAGYVANPSEPHRQCVFGAATASQGCKRGLQLPCKLAASKRTLQAPGLTIGLGVLSDTLSIRDDHCRYGSVTNTACGRVIGSSVEIRRPCRGGCGPDHGPPRHESQMERCRTAVSSG